LWPFEIVAESSSALLTGFEALCWNCNTILVGDLGRKEPAWIEHTSSPSRKEKIASTELRLLHLLAVSSISIAPDHSLHQEEAIQIFKHRCHHLCTIETKRFKGTKGQRVF